MRSYAAVYPFVGDDPFTLSGSPNSSTFGKFALIRPHKALLVAAYNYFSAWATIGQASGGYTPPNYIFVEDSVGNIVTVDYQSTFKANLDAIFPIIDYKLHPLD